jgi:predicted DNA-binding transcriptional regulator AlpA
MNQILRDHQDFRLPARAAPSFDAIGIAVSHAERATSSTGHAFENDRKTHEKLLGAKEVAHWLGVSRAWVFEHSNGRRRPLLPSVKLGKSVRYRPVDVDAFIVECERFSRRGAA